MKQESNIYSTGFALTAVLVFFGSWIYCIGSYGFFLGVALGWIPAMIFAVVVGALWPLIAIGIAIIFMHH